MGIGRAAQVYGYIKSASNMSQNYYPERLGKLYVINAPWGFSTVFSVIKGWLDPVTVGKIHILGSGYKDELAKQVPKENLPVVFGGTCECKGEGGCGFSDMGPWQDKQWARTPKWAKNKVGETGAQGAHVQGDVQGQDQAQKPVSQGAVDLVDEPKKGESNEIPVAAGNGGVGEAKPEQIIP